MNTDIKHNVVSSGFWRNKALDELNTEEWEALCDGCGRCCLNKLEDWDTGDIYWTNVACRLLDDNTCRCKDYSNRFKKVPDCISLDPQTVRITPWLPLTCAYRLIDEGKELLDWHPLISGNAESVHEAGISVKGRTITEDDVPVEEFENHLADWLDVIAAEKNPTE